MKALTFWAAGYRNVTASYGVNGFTDELLAAFKQYGTERILIAYDRDEAGEKAASSLAARLMKEGIDCYRIQFPKGMDANEYALHVQPTSKSLGVVIRSAVWLGKGKAPKREPVPEVKEEKAAKNKIDQSSSFTAPAHPASAALAHPCASAAESQTIPETATPEPAKPLPASVIPEAPTADIEAEVKADEVIMSFGDCVFHVKSATDSTANRPPVPRQTGHLFHGKPARCSTRTWPPIPRQIGHPFRVNPAT